MTRSTWLPLSLALLVLAALVVMFDEGLAKMVLIQWQMPEYQHSFLIPFISLYLIWARATDLQRVPMQASWAGAGIVAFGFVVFLLGEFSAIATIVQYAFLITLLGLVVAVIGVRASAVVWAGLAYLFFMIPLPNLVTYNLSGLFQLWSSQIGTAFLRLVGISVYLEGNVIDLGVYKLQVVEACSGLRYLFPLTSFAFFCAYIFRGRLWQKVVIFLSAVPITILMNSFRIAVTGVLVNQYGTSQAEGFLHYFEGWIIFVACIALLFLEMALFSLASGRRLAETFEVEIPALGDFRYLVPQGGLKPPVTAALVLVVAGAVGSFAIGAREELVPERVTLQRFPLVIGQWEGQDSRLETEVLEVLKPSDYLIASYSAAASPLPVELYIAYYDSQRKDATVHSPRACLPGGGWLITDIAQRELPDLLPDGGALPVNRVVIEQRGQRALVYYWFMQRGRYLTSEYLVKWFIFWDALTRNRTDGAMVRVMTFVPEGTDIAAADERVQAFIRAAEPKVYYHVPGEVVAAAANVPDRR
ncbi:MAG: VPLPA-CTERM-specific exosortase XrtD [Gammaproteobacteria bacterium]|nr:VPLPA-CTERM-specific exosortase XrtD [Gammaproteobacteria bacterium]